MKRLLTMCAIPFMLVIFISCTSGTDNEDIIDPPLESNDVTFAGDVKSIIDSRCLNCHGNPVANGAPMSLTTYSEVKSAVETRGLIESVEDGTMPPSGTDLTAAQVQTLKDWKSGGFKE